MRAILYIVPALIIVSGCHPTLQRTPGWELELVTIRTMSDELYIDYYVLAHDNAHIWFSRNPGQSLISAVKIPLSNIQGIYSDGENITGRMIHIDPQRETAEYVRGIRNMMYIGFGIATMGAIAMIVLAAQN
jgi:hypothetical protein